MICKKCGNDLEDLRGDSWDDDECPYCNIVETRADDRDRSVIIGGNKYKMKNVVAITKDPYDGTTIILTGKRQSNRKGNTRLWL